MLKKHFKVIVSLIAIITLVSVFCVTVRATEDVPVVTSDTPEISDSTTEETSNEVATISNHEENEKDDIIYHDLYILDNNVTMDKSVDGNVYILGSDVKITGKINGNLFVLGKDIEITAPYNKDDSEHKDENYCYIAGSAFICGDKVTFNAIAQDVYAVANIFDMAYDSYIMRDVRLAAAKVIMKGYITRDVYLVSDNINFGTPSENSEENDAALIAGDLHYTATSEIEIPDSVVQGDTKFTKTEKSDDTYEKPSKSVADYLWNLLEVLIYTIVVYLIINWIAPKFFENSAEVLKNSALLSVGIGLITLIVPFVVGIPVLFLCAPFAITLFTIYGLLIALCFTVVSGSLTYLFKDKFGFSDKKVLLLAIVTIVLWALKQIPVLGGIITFAITIVGLGIIIKNLIPKKEETK